MEDVGFLGGWREKVREPFCASKVGVSTEMTGLLRTDCAPSLIVGKSLDALPNKDDEFGELLQRDVFSR